MKHIKFLLPFLICVCGVPSYAQICPEFLKPGDKVAVVAPGFGLRKKSLDRAVQVLKSWGLEPVLGRNLAADEGLWVKKTNTYMPTDEGRESDLRWALQDEDIKAIICARGGFGTIHIIDRIPLEMYSSQPKWIVGYSDITTLHAASVLAGVMSIHGNMCGEIGSDKGPNKSCDALRELLMGKIPEYVVPAHPCNTIGYAEGTLVGGNIATLEALAGTDYDITAKKDIILFIEEVGETYHKIDRYLHSLELQGKLPYIRGIVVGEFYKCSEDMPFETVEEMLQEFTSKLSIPVCYGFPVGHGDVNMPLIEGAPVALDVRQDSAVLTFKISEQK